MIKGFFGPAAASYLSSASNAHTLAMRTTTQASSQVNSQNPAGGGTISFTPSRQLPFASEDAKSGSFITGRGNSSNIVAGQGIYNEIARMITRADDKAGECLYRIAMEVENMCNTIFVLPEASPQCLNIAATTKSFLEEYRALTDEITANMRSFAQEITDIH